MNEQEAIDHINSMCNSCRYWYNGKCHEDGNCFEAMQMSIKALEKQMPKKPIYSEFDDNGNDEIIPNKAICPTCRYEFEFGTWNEEENHHCKCGQKVDWSVKDE